MYQLKMVLFMFKRFSQVLAELNNQKMFENSMPVQLLVKLKDWKKM